MVYFQNAIVNTIISYFRIDIKRVVLHSNGALLHKDRKYGNNKRVAQETYSKGRDE